MNCPICHQQHDTTACPTPITYYGQGQVPHKCPVCDGTGKVSRPPYVAGDLPMWSDTLVGPYQCSPCGGKRYSRKEGMIVSKAKLDRLRALAKVAAGDRETLLSEFTMRIPAERDRDADLVLSWAADEIEQLQAELQQSQEIRSDMESLLSMVGEALGVPEEPHQTWQERLLQAVQPQSEQESN